MKRTLNTVLFIALITAQLIGPSAFAACTQGGQCNVGGCTGAQQLYDVDFSESCTPFPWVYTSGPVTIVKSGGTEMCGGYFQSYAKLNYNSGSATKVWQYVSVPWNETRTTWTAAWNVSFTDPNHSATNDAYVRVYDADTGTLLGQSQVYYGDGTDPNCRRDIINLGSHDFHGHTLKVEITAHINYTDTHYFFTNVNLVVS